MKEAASIDRFPVQCEIGTRSAAKAIAADNLNEGFEGKNL
jgi:hypothetical protein